MTTPTSSTSAATGDHFDTGPLSWVMGEVREALTRSKTSLTESVGQDADGQSTGLRQAKTYLHQAHGALQIVDVDGLSIITETVEDLFERVESGQLALSAELAHTVENAYHALLEYLEELLSGAAHQPVRLFPYYRALLEAKGAERIHPADLFFPNLGIRPQLPASGVDEPADYLALRKRFERALLPFLKSGGTAGATHASAMRDIIVDVQRAQSNTHSRAFWWVMQGFADVVASGQFDSDVYIKQLFARINLQIRRLSEGSSSIAERLLRDALFFVARAEKPSAQVQQIRAAYALDGLVPIDYQKQRYGRIDVEALRAAKDRLSQAKNIWNRIAGGDASGAASFESEMQALNAASAKLNAPPLSALLKQMTEISRHAAATSSGALGLEVATSLLFVENALNNISHLPDDFPQRSEAMGARLRSIVAGQNPTESAEWLDDISRQAQQRQTMVALSAEMQTSLRQVEKTLDEYFRDPTQREGLLQVEGVLHQLEGAFAILDQDDAVEAIRHTKTSVQHFAATEEAPDLKKFQQVAQNVGALSFFIEALQLQADQAKKRFEFDRALGVLKTNLLERKTKTESAPTIEIDSAADAAASKENTASAGEDERGPFPTVEDELAQHQKQSAELANSLSAEPDNPMLQEQLKESLQRVRRDATLIDNPEANDRAQAAIRMLEQPDFVPTQDALATIIAAGPTPAAAVPAPVAASTPSSDEAVDAELLEIFLGEAEEVLACVCETIPQSRNEPYNQDHLTTLRRSFHTLKGSGRMVGLMVFGEAAWSIEQVLNLRLSETRAGDAELYALLEKAAELLGGWVEDLKTHGRSDRTATALVNAAERVKSGGAFVFEEVEIAPPAIEAPVSSDVAGTQDDFIAPVQEAELSTLSKESEAGLDMPATLAEAEEIELSDEDMAALREGTLPSQETVGEIETADLQLDVPQTPAVADVIDFPTAEPATAKPDDNIKQIGSLQISVPLYNIYLAETDELVRILSQDIAEWRHEPEREVHVPVVHAAHSLAGSSATVGFTPLQEISHALEMVLQSLARKPVRLNTEDFDTLDHSIERIRFMLQMFALGEMPDHETHQAEILDKMLRDIETRTSFSAGMIAAAYADPVKETPAEPAPAVIDLMPEPEEEALSPEAPAMPALDEESRPDNDVPEAAGQNVPVAVDEMQGAAESPQIAAPIEMIDVIRVAPAAEAVPTESEANAGQPSSPALADDGNNIAQASSPQVVPAHPVSIRDDLDADLLPVFLEEGKDMLPQIAETLRGWQSNPQNMNQPQALLRFLHTVKGSARMAGAMEFGQHMHDMETRIEHLTQSASPQLGAIDDLLARFDQGLQMFEQLLNPTAPSAPAPVETAVSQSNADAVAAPQQVVLQSLMPAQQAGGFAPMSAVKPAAATPAAAVAASLVRVRADILDRLVNQAGEVSISRSKLETEVGTIRQSLTELNENIARLRVQLREIEMQAESQISSRMAQSGDREFDPLEFDRYTRLQELTRMMAESVNDVGSVQQNLTRTVDSANNDLTTQARLTRDLQQDLMRVRMVQFASISERLYRVTRQASKEINKRVNLDIRGSSVEIDRGVLERMAGPFEHLLRNAIVHGIESREARLAAGKSEIGELRVEIRQEGNEVVIHFSDDGQGLNLARIREKAISIGLLENNAEVSDAEVTDLIFHPGFSTVEQVTELAGRGVGTDVVRSEAAALGGRVAVFSEAGKGAHFTIHLPLTLAVTQVVLLSAGGKNFAVPSVLVEQVQQLKINPLTAAYNDGAVIWQGQRVPLHYLSTLLGDTDATPVAQQYSPILILRSGNERVALHVDAVQGNREVVVKNIGPQLARMIGIAGATVMGSGDIVLILNPVPLAQRMAQENLRAPRITPSDAPSDMGAVAEMASTPATPKSEPVQGLRTQHIVMVVDDSLTVRRVTQRLLVREGYQVVLAKDGVDALEHLQSITPDVMLVDIEMPRMDGFDLTRNVRGDERTRHIPIIMITSRTATKHRNYALELGVNEYLGKPYQEDTLLKQIATFVGKETPVA